MSVRQGKGADGADVILWSCGHTDEFIWKFDGQMIRSHASRVEGKLRKKDEPDQLCLAVRESDYKDGQGIIVWSCNTKDPGQRWIKDGDRLRLEASKDYCLSVQQGRAGDGQNFLLWTCDVAYQTQQEL